MIVSMYLTCDCHGANEESFIPWDFNNAATGEISVRDNNISFSRANCKTKNSLVTDNAQTTAITSNLGQN